MQGNRIDFVNTLRGFAALAVVIAHYTGNFWSMRTAVASLTNAPELPSETYAWPSYLVWLHVFPLFNWGAFGVAIFFIISGFVIPLSLQKMTFHGFLLSRIIRIIPTYIIGFTITLTAILISSKYFSVEWPFNNKEILIHYIPGIRDLLYSRSIDGIIWTLEIEMKFYLICAILISVFRKHSIKVFITPLILFLFALYINKVAPEWINSNISAFHLAMAYMFFSQYIIYMFIGTMFYYMYCGYINANKAYLGIGILFTLFCILWWAGPYSASINVAWSYAFALLVFAFAYAHPKLFKSNRFFDFFANISYPLYIIHGVAGYVALRILLEMGFKAWVSLLIVTFSIIFSSWLIHILIESPSQRAGKRLVAKRGRPLKKIAQPT